MSTRIARAGLLAMALIFGAARAASAADRLCDPGLENCRTILINLIRAEQVGIDVAFWFMEDSRYTTELINRWRAGVPIRVLVDPRAELYHPLNADRLAELQAAGIPMRDRTAPDVLHWKMMLFAGQNTVEFSGANYSAAAFSRTSVEPLVDYVDEAIFFTDDAAIVNSFRTKYDDLWTNTTLFQDRANVPLPLTRRYGTFAIDPRIVFGGDAFRERAIAAFQRETRAMDAIVYRITDPSLVVAIIQARLRGVTVRLITEPDSYRPPLELADRWWYDDHAAMVDLLYRYGVQIRHRAHAGLTHQKSVILRGLGLAVFGSSNWEGDHQEQHNMFTTDPAIFAWFDQQFDRKWNNTTGVVETAAFTPLPPDKPHNPAPANLAIAVPPAAGLTLKWTGGPWAQLYDLYMGLTPTQLYKLGTDLPLGSGTPTQQQQVTLPFALPPGTVIYWQIVSKTFADMRRTSNLWSFTTQ
jgi:hypothetical protein